MLLALLMSTVGIVLSPPHAAIGDFRRSVYTCRPSSNSSSHLGTLTGEENVSALVLELLQQMTYREVSTQTMAQSVSLAV